APLEPDSCGGVAGGVPGGVPGGQMGGVLGGVIGGVLNTAARPVPPPPSVKPKGPIRVGGHVRPPKIIVKVQPEYPPLARQVHIQGRSEEHTSELQSRSDLVCRLLLEKKNKIKYKL